MTDMQDFNAKIIEEFRANQGVVGGQFEGAPLLLLTTTGAKSGQPRVTPVVYRAEGDRVFADHAAVNPGFAEYQANTERVIPVVELVRV